MTNQAAEPAADPFMFGTVPSMAEMTPREQAHAVRQQSRTLIATLRANRRAAAAKVVVSRDSKKTPLAPVSTRTSKFDMHTAPPSDQAPPTMERRTREAERLRREATRNRLAVAEEIKRLRDARWEAKVSDRTAKTAPVKAIPGPRAVVATAVPVAKPAAVFASTFPGGFAQKAKAPQPSHRAPVAKADTRSPLDIDTISGLGTALKSKLRRLGLGTVEKLAAQQPEPLRKQLGPAGRLVNIEALIRSARTATGAKPSASRGRGP